MAPSLVGIGPIWLDRRQAGLKNPLGTKSHIYKQIYSNILPYGSWDHTFNNTYTSVHGGVFCLEFSPDGSLLVAACEKRSVLMFDPLTHKRIHSVENAHSDCVNCVKFLDSRSFATSSDDFTVALWDARNLNQKVRSLKGHSNWVKNIEYSPRDGLLVTSGFDGSVLTWEMNTYRENGTVFNKVFSTNGLMRTCLTPDASKMVICTTGGYLIVIHNLNLNTLGQDLDGFKPNMYRLMQLSQTILPIASDFTDLFRGRGKRNRVEFITDFPEGDDAEVVSSLQIHPDGHCAISRNVSNNEKSEWSCIHNIEESFSSDDESDFTDYEDDCDDDDNDDDDDDDNDDEDIGGKFKKKISMRSSWPGSSTSVSTTPSYIIQHSVVENDRFPGVRGESGHQGESVSPSDVWEALVAIQEARFRRESESIVSEMSMGHMFRRQFSGTDSQYRPSISERQIFVHRILPNTEANRERGPGSTGEQTTAPSNVRNTITNGAETIPPDTGRRGFESAASKFWRKKKSFLSQRYDSLYRRSLVGLYDRTSVLRKPIYHYRRARLKTLKNNYTFNETRKFRNQNERNSVTKKFSAMLAERRNAGASINRWIRRSVPATPSHKYEQKNVELKPGIGVESGRRTVSTSGSREGNLDGYREVRSPSDPNEENLTTTAGEPETRSVSSTSDSYGNRKTVSMEISKANSRYETRENLVGNNDVTTVTVSSSAKTNFCSVSGENSRRERRNYKLGIKKNKKANKTCGMDAMKNSQKGNRNNCKTKDEIRNRMTSPLSTKIHRNSKRLTHYVEEPNLGRGFIKEQCFSPDGRIICSPFGNGIRLLSFSPTVQDIFHCYPPSPPIPLHELTLNVVHSDTVVSTKFSPFHNLLVSGCLSGKIVYYQPFL